MYIIGLLVDVNEVQLLIKHEFEGFPNDILHSCYNIYYLQCLRQILHKKGKTFLSDIHGYVF